MNFSNPKNIAAANSLIISTVSVLVLLLFNFFKVSNTNWIGILFLGATTFITAFLLLKVSLEQFIYRKVKIIYKTISNSKTDKKDKQKIKEFQKKNIEAVNKDVLAWAKEREQEIEELKKMQLYRQEFLGNVSHELKTPICNIQGYVLTLLDGGLEDTKVNRKYLLRTEQSINRMISIVEDLEEISKVESGELELNLEKFDIVDLTKEIIDLFEIKSNKKNITVYLHKHHEKPIFIIADKESIRQILTNLIDNSIKYGKESGKTKISFFDMDENIQIEVTDDGIGIEKEKIPRLFERFFRDDKSRSRQGGGSGLGLAIVKHLIEAHNQSINVRSTPGIGTTFAFTMKKA